MRAPATSGIDPLNELIVTRVSTRVILLDPDRPDPDALDLGARIIKQGGLVAFATETVYGLGANATDAVAVADLRGQGTAGNQSVDCPCAEQRPGASLCGRMAGLGRTSRPFVLAWSAHPGASTFGVDTRSSDSRSGHGCHPRTRGTVAAALIERAQRPIAAPSANRANRISPTRAEHVLADLDGRVDLILESGPTALGLESTVIDLNVPEPRILRPGPITRECFKRCSAVACSSRSSFRLATGFRALGRWPCIMRRRPRPCGFNRLAN